MSFYSQIDVAYMVNFQQFKYILLMVDVFSVSIWLHSKWYINEICFNFCSAEYLQHP